MRPKTRYARNKEGHHVAYQILGSGPPDIVFVPDWVTNLEIMWEEATVARFLDRLASFGRLICFDKRGTGVSDPVSLSTIPTWEEWMDDVFTVVAAAGSGRTAVFGHGDGGQMALLFAASHPNRTSALVLVDAYARRRRAADYPCGVPDSIAEQICNMILETWGTGAGVVRGAHNLALDPSFLEWRGRYERLAISPGQFRAIYPRTFELDFRPVLETIRAPTLVISHRDNPYVYSDNGRYLAEHIHGAEFLELPGAQHLFHAGDIEAMLGPVQEFLTGTREIPEEDRVLATVLFTDIATATEHAERLGGRGWADLLARHHALVRDQLERFRGREIDNAGDGFFATFDGPARAVRCALAIRNAVQSLGIDIRVGLHTGECEIVGDKVSGIAVHIGARVMSRAQPGEVLVSRTVKDLVAGSGLEFGERGTHELKGVAGKWELFAAS